MRYVSASPDAALVTGVAPWGLPNRRDWVPPRASVGILYASSHLPPSSYPRGYPLAYHAALLAASVLRRLITDYSVVDAVWYVNAVWYTVTHNLWV